METREHTSQLKDKVTSPGGTAIAGLASLESGGLREGIILVQIPRYAEDFKRIGSKLSRIWNAFLRGQFIIFLATSAVYAVVLSILGVRYAIILALLTGFANFLPYVGPAINWVVLGLVTIFQPGNYFAPRGI